MVNTPIAKATVDKQNLYFKNKSPKCVHKAFGKIGAAAGDISITEYFSRDLNPIWTGLTLFVVPFKVYGSMLWIQI